MGGDAVDLGGAAAERAQVARERGKPVARRSDRERQTVGQCRLPGGMKSVPALQQSQKTLAFERRAEQIERVFERAMPSGGGAAQLGVQRRLGERGNRGRDGGGQGGLYRG